MKRQTTKGKKFAEAHQHFINSGRSYVGIVSVLEDASLKPPARILFHIISSLSYLEGFCYATNETLSNKLGLENSMLKQYLKELKTNKIIDTKMVKCSYGIRREIYINFDMLYKRYENVATT